MKLTNIEREQFVSSVMKAMPYKHSCSTDRLSEQLTDQAYRMLPDDVKRLAKKYPGLVATQSKTLKLAEKGDPLCASSWTDDTLSFSHPRIVEPESIDTAWALAAYREHRQEILDRDELRARLTCVAKGCATSEKLAEALPDLAQFIPDRDPRNFALVADNKPLIADLKKAGLQIPLKKGSK